MAFDVLIVEFLSGMGVLVIFFIWRGAEGLNFELAAARTSFV